MQATLTFVRDWYGHAVRPLRRADPLLMGAAFAFNALFAFVPLSLAFVSMLTLFDSGFEMLDWLYAVISETLPTDVAELLIRMMSDSVATLESNRLVILAVSTVIALWSGSRAVYAIQKAFRLVDPDDENSDVGYLRLRLTAIVVTIGAGAGVVLAYILLIVGSGTVGWLVTATGRIPNVAASVGVAVVACGWLFFLLYGMYRWAVPASIPRPGLTAAVVTAVVVLGGWAVANVLPVDVTAVAAAFGVVGLVLLWLYGVGIVIVGIPIVIGSLLEVLEQGPPQQPDSDVG